MVRQPPISSQLASMPASPGSSSWSIRSQAGRQHAEVKLYKADEVDASLCMVAQALRLKNHMIADLQARLDTALQQQSSQPAEGVHLTLHIDTNDSSDPLLRPQLQQPVRHHLPSPHQQSGVPLASSPGAESVAAREPTSSQGSPEAEAMSDSLGTDEAARWPVGPEYASGAQEQQERLAQQLAAAQQALAQSQEQVARLGVELAGREPELPQLRQAVEEWKDRAEEQQGTAQRLQAAEAQGQERAETLTTQLGSLAAEPQQAGVQLPASQAPATEVQSIQDGQAVPAAQTLEQQAMALRERVAEREAALAAVQQEAAELRQRLSEKEAERAGVTEEASRLQQQCEAQLQSSAGDLLVQNQLEVGSAQAQLTSVAADMLVHDQLEAQAEHAQLASAAADVLVERQLAVGALRGDLATRDEIIGQLQQEAAGLREQLAAQEKDLARAWKEAAKAAEQLEAQLQSAAADLLVENQLEAQTAEAQHASAAAGLLVGSQLKSAAEQAQLTSAAADLLVQAKLEAHTEHMRLTSAAADMLVDDQLEFGRLNDALAARDDAIVRLQQEAMRLRESLAEREDELAKSREEAAEANRQLEARLESVAADLLMQSQLEAESSAAKLKSVAADLLVQSELDCEAQQAQLKSAAADLLVQSELDCQMSQAQLKSAAADLLVQSRLEVESLKGDLAARAEAIVQLQQEAAGLRERLAGQEEELARAREEAAKGREQLEAMLKSAAAGLLVQTELEALRAETQLKSAAADLLVQSQLEVESLKGDLTVRDEIIVQLQQARAKAEERAEDLTEQVQSKIGELQQARAFLAASHEEAASLKSALRLRDEALAHLQQERAQLEAAMEVRAAEQMQLLDTLQQYLGMCDNATAAWSLEGEAPGDAALPEGSAATGAPAVSPPPAGAAEPAGDVGSLVGADASSAALGTPRAEGPPGGSSSSRLLELLSPASADRLSHFERRLEFWHQRLASAAKLRGGDSGSLSSSPAKSGQEAGRTAAEAATAGMAAAEAPAQVEKVGRGHSSKQSAEGVAAATAGRQEGSMAVEEGATGGGPVRLEGAFSAAAEGERQHAPHQEQQQQQQQQQESVEEEEEEWQVPGVQQLPAPSRTESFSEHVFFHAGSEQEPAGSRDGEGQLGEGATGDVSGQQGSSPRNDGSGETRPVAVPAGGSAAAEGQQGGSDAELQESGEQQDGEGWVVLSRPAQALAQGAAEGGSLRRAGSPNREVTPPRPIPAGHTSPGALDSPLQQQQEHQQGMGLESHPIELSPSGSLWLGSSASSRHASLTGTRTAQGGSLLLRSAVRSLAAWPEGGGSPQQQQQAEPAQQAAGARERSPTKIPFAPRPSHLGRGPSSHMAAAEAPQLQIAQAPAETMPAAAREPPLEVRGEPEASQEQPQSEPPSPPPLPPPPQQQQEQQPALARLTIPPVSSIPAPRPLTSSLSFSYRPASRVTQLPSSPTKLQRTSSGTSQKEAGTPTQQQQQQQEQEQRERLQEGRVALQPSRLPQPPPRPSPPPQKQQQQVEAPGRLSDRLAAALADPGSSNGSSKEAQKQTGGEVPGLALEQGRPGMRQSSSTASGRSSRQGLARMSSATARRAVPVVATKAGASGSRSGGGESAMQGQRLPRVAAEQGADSDSGIQGAFATELLERLNIYSPRKGGGADSRSSSLKF